ncbi:unnamed protein product [Camellia sinensis]
MTKTMVESIPPNPNSIEPPATAGDPPPPPLPPTDGGGGFLSLPRRPGIRLTTEFDSDSSIFFNKISCKLLDSLAKLKLSFQNNDKGEISEPQLALTSKCLSLHYDLEEHNALIKSSFDVGPALHLRAAHDVKAQQGEVAIVADLAGPAYKFELASAVPSVGLPKATFNFPLGEISLEEKEEEEVKKMLSINGIVKGHLLNGVCTAQYKEENINLRYLYKCHKRGMEMGEVGWEFILVGGTECSKEAPWRLTLVCIGLYHEQGPQFVGLHHGGRINVANSRWFRFHPTIMTLVTNAGEDNGLEFLILQIRAQGDHLPIKHWDEQMAFIPSLSLPSNALSFAFKRRFGPSDKLSYWYNFDSNNWSTVYKHTVGKDYKFKVGYDSEVRLGWASLWVGDESGKAKTAPMKAKIQCMLQVPQDDIKSSALMFRVKKRWDI